MVVEAHRRVDAGDAGEVTWEAWARWNIHVKLSRLYELQHIGEAENPAKALEALRERGRERVRKSREKKARAERAQEAKRKELITWAKDAPLNRVREVWNQIERDKASYTSRKLAA